MSDWIDELMWRQAQAIDAPRDLRERFLDVVIASDELATEPAADAAWQLIMDTWRIAEVASARDAAPANPNREEWMAALRLAIFRAEHPECPA